jgi:hypothetical protein
MSFMAVNWIAVIVAAIVSWVLGAGWYMVFSKQWLAAIGKTKDQINSRDPTPFIWSIIVQLVMAYFVALLTPQLFGVTNIANGLMTGALMWLAFSITTMIQNHRYEGAPWSRTVIDGGYTLVILLVHGLVIGFFGGGAVAPAA